jgi:hypothetical protein
MVIDLLIVALHTTHATPHATPRIIERAISKGYQPCIEEDSIGPCYWDATVRGNGKGRSFVINKHNRIRFSSYSK